MNFFIFLAGTPSPATTQAPGIIDTIKSIPDTVTKIPYGLFNTTKNVIGNTVSGAIWEWFGGLADNATDMASSLIVSLVIKFSDIERYFVDYQLYLGYMQVIAASLLIFLAIYEGVHRMGGTVLNNAEDTSLSSLIGRAMIATTGIYFLPHFMTTVLIPLNNWFVQFTYSLGTNLETMQPNTFSNLLLNGFIAKEQAGVSVFTALVMGVALLVVGIQSGIRYIQLIVCGLFAPFIAASYVKDGERVEIWFRETLSVVFTQGVQVLLLGIMIKVISNVNLVFNPAARLLLIIGFLVVIIQGPQVLRTFLYSTGVGSAGTSLAGKSAFGAVRFMVMKR